MDFPAARAIGGRRSAPFETEIGFSSTTCAVMREARRLTICLTATHGTHSSPMSRKSSIAFNEFLASFLSDLAD
jgi:hypothetical protein